MNHSPVLFQGLRRLLHSTITFPLPLSLNHTLTHTLSLTLTLILPLTLTLTLALTSGFLTSCSDDSSNGNLDAAVDSGEAGKGKKRSDQTDFTFAPVS